MICVDSSVWIAHLRDEDREETRKLRSIPDPAEIIVGDLILLEVLQGASSEAAAMVIERMLRRFDVRAMLDGALAIKAAQNYRGLRGRGVTVRKTIDLIIGTYCIEHGIALLHADRDFDPMQRYLGLRVA